MEKDPSHCWQSPWQNANLSCIGSVNPPNLGRQNTIPMVFPACINPCDYYTACGNMAPGFSVSKFLQRSSAIVPPLDPMNVPSEAIAQKRFLIFDQSGDQTSLIFSSVGPPYWHPDSTKRKPSYPCGLHVDLPINNDPINWSDETNISDGHGCDEMHEDTEEIDALLYSDSEDFLEEKEEETSTGHSLVGMTKSSEEVASHTAPTKRRRLDASLMDTASSARVHRSCDDYEDVVDNNDDGESNCVRGRVGGGMEEQDPSNACKRLKREERLRETLGVLRKIIPGGSKGKDAAVVLDEAIRYLRSLKLKAKALGASL